MEYIKYFADENKQKADVVVRSIVGLRKSSGNTKNICIQAYFKQTMVLTYEEAKNIFDTFS